MLVPAVLLWIWRRMPGIDLVLTEVNALDLTWLAGSL